LRGCRECDALVESREVASIYEVVLNTLTNYGSSSAAGGAQTCSAAVDPMIVAPKALTVDFSPNLNTTPLSATLPLFATGLGAMLFLRWRRKRKAQTVVT
jgi:hypothetical protein